MLETTPPGHPRLWRLLRQTGGFALVGIGIPMLFLPGPGLPTILWGLGVLAQDYSWAKSVLVSLKGHGARLAQALPARVQVAQKLRWRPVSRRSAIGRNLVSAPPAAAVATAVVPNTVAATIESQPPVGQG